MSAITVSPEVRKLLGNLNDVTELWDNEGYFLGLFTPPKLAEVELAKRDEQYFDLEEAERQLATKQETFTTEEVLAHLQSLEKTK